MDANLIDIPIHFQDEANGGFKSTFDRTASKQQDFLSISKLDVQRKKRENTAMNSMKICSDLKNVLVKAAHKVRSAEEKRDSDVIRLRSKRLQSN